MFLVTMLFILIVATSTGTQSGIDNNVLGACRSKNMRITLNVCCDPSTSEYGKCNAITKAMAK